MNAIIENERSLKRIAVRMVERGYYSEEDYLKFIRKNHLYEMANYYTLRNGLGADQ